MIQGPGGSCKSEVGWVMQGRSLSRWGGWLGHAGVLWINVEWDWIGQSGSWVCRGETTNFEETKLEIFDIASPTFCVL